MDSADEIPHHLLKEEYGINTFPSINFSKENKLCYGNKSAIVFCYCYILLAFTEKLGIHRWVEVRYC